MQYILSNALFIFSLKKFIAQKIRTACSKTNDKNVPLTNLNKCINNDKS